MLVSIEAVKQKCDVVMAPGYSCYFDHYQVANEDKEPWPLEEVQELKMCTHETMPEELSIEEQQYILGAQGNVWTEYMETTDYVEYMILPRMTALSEVVWS